MKSLFFRIAYVTILFSLSASSYAQQIAKEGMTPEPVNYHSFSRTAYEEKGLPYNAPCTNCKEDLSARNESSRTFYGTGKDNGLIYTQSAYSSLNVKNDAGKWVPLDARLKYIQPGVYAAKDQNFPTKIDINQGSSIENTYGKIIYNRHPELIWKSNDGNILSLGKANFTNHTAGNDGVRIIDAWPGIDIEMRVLVSGIKTNFVIKNRPTQTQGNFIIRDEVQLSQGLKLTPNGDELQAMTSSGQEAFFISACIGYDNNIRETNQIQEFRYELTDNVLDIIIPISILQDPRFVYPYTVDPLVTSTSTLPQASITGSRYTANDVFVNYCSYFLNVPSPVNATITDIQWSFSYIATGLCWMRDGANTFHSGGYTSPNLAGYYWYCNNNQGGNCPGTNISIYSDLAPGLPPPSCASQDIPFEMRFYRRYSAGSTCSNSCIGAASPWVMTLIGRTVESAATSTNICQGNSATLNGVGSYGVPPYQYSWSPGGATGSPATVSPSTTTTYTLTVTDACAQTSTANTTVNVTPQPAAPTITTNSPVCIGNTINLSTTNSGTYVWTGPNGFTSNLQNPTIPSATAANSGTYSLYTVASGCTSATATSTVNVVSAPALAPSFTTNTPVCEGATITLNASAYPFVNYIWSGPNGYTASGQNVSIPSATLANAGNYSLSVAASGCTSVATVLSVVITPAPAAPTVGGNSPICAGSTISLMATGSGAGTYSWTGPNAFTSTTQNPSIPSATTANGGNYGAVYIEGNCSSAVANYNVIVHPIPATPVLSSNSPVCIGTPLNLSTTTTTSGTYVWTGPNSFTSSLQNPTIASTTTANSGNYNLNIVENGCTSAVATIAVNVVNPPIVPSFTTNSPVCAGSTITLSGTFYPIVNYIWSGPNGFSASGQNASIPSATTANAGTYSLYLSASGCTSTAATMNVIVNPAPAAPVVTGNSPVCAGTAINLTATGTGSGTYAWTGPNAFISTTQNPSISSATTSNTGTYTAVFIQNSCTSAVANYNVVVNPIPNTPIASSNSPVCIGNTINLSTPTVNNATYSWTGPSFSSSSQNPNISSATTAMSGSYSVTITQNGCSSIAGTTNVVVTPPPAAPTITSNGPICEGGTLNLGTSATASNYSWSGPNGFSSTSQNPSLPGFTSAQAGTYSLYIVSGSCTSATASVSVLVAPVAQVSYTGPTQICGSDVILTVTANVAAPSSIASIIWNAPNAIGTGTSLNHTFTQVAPNSVSGNVVVTTNSNCVTTVPFNIQLLDVPTPNFTNESVCDGQSLQFNEQYVWEGNETINPNYNWLYNGVSFSTAANPTHNFGAPGTYFVTLITSNPNLALCSDIITKQVTVLPIPTLDFTFKIECVKDVQFTGTSTPDSLATTYSWNFDDGATGTGASTSHGFSQTGLYDVMFTVITSDGCTTSVSKPVQIDKASSDLPEIPNIITPNGDNVNDFIDFQTILGSCGDFECSIFNRWGNVVFTSKNGIAPFVGKNTSGTWLTPGVYFYSLIYSDSKANGTITIIR